MKQLYVFFAIIALAASACKSHRDAFNNTSSSQTVERPSVPQSQKTCINLNNATPDELKGLPGIGEVMAQRVVDYRKRHGRFRRAQDVIIVEGFSEKKYRAIADRICIE